MKEFKGPKKIKLESKKPAINTRHIRWNWRISPNSSSDLNFARYFFVVVDDKFRENKIENILENTLRETIMNYSFEKIGPSIEGNVSGTKLKYLCEVYDSCYSPKIVEKAIKKISSKKDIRDENLYDRIKSGTSLERYLSNLYESSKYKEIND